MQRPSARLCVTFCVLAMAGIGIAAFAWWGVSWITFIFLTIGLACLAAIIYAWITARRIDRLLERQVPPVSGEQAHKEAEQKKRDDEK